MKKRKNTGFSIVEILISLTIFMLLMMPIVSGIISSLNMSTDAKELQYRNEFAENLMEHVKAVPIDEVRDEDYYLKNGTTSGTFQPGTKERRIIPADLDGDGTIGSNEKLDQTRYFIQGDTVLGTQKTPYSYAIEIDNEYYVQKQIADPTFVDPNNLALGIVEDIDYNKVALIDGTILNYDVAASKAFKAKKLQALKEVDETGYQQQIEGTGVDLFARDTASRLTTIEVSGDSIAGFQVRCLVDYIDYNSSLGTDNHVQYVPYAQSFTGELPNIYLMYNPCYYNNDYSADDYIVVDTTDLTSTEVNVFLVEIAKTYSDRIVASNSLKEGEEGKVLYREEVKNGGYRENVKIHIAAAVSYAQDLKNIKVYHNIGNNSDSAGNTLPNQKSDLYHLCYKQASLISSEESAGGMVSAVDAKLLQFQDIINAGLSSGEVKSYKPLCSGSAFDATVGWLNGATEENRSLYKVRVWLKKKSDGAIDINVDQPILQGTKGGNET
ncbi:MAG: prepilin-type N-terminal cleavage/methylation domain-containing protein [Clostridium sp.]|nr:prepilin-type N-terminal cleavage/methylation domain-containing protein [Clostridium sp.]